MVVLHARDFDWRSAQVVQWHLDEIDGDDGLIEDLAQIEFATGVILDVGWYVDTFAIVIVRDDWEHPLYERRVKDAATLDRELRAAIEVAHQHATR
jgi:hypothetical protein